jgi:L-cysteine desulfidase
MDIKFFTETYGGWIGLVMYFAYKELWPLIYSKLIPAKLKAIEDARKDMELEQLAKLKELEADHNFHREIERERLIETRKISEATQTLALSMVQTNSNIQSILTNQTLILTRQDSTLSVLNNAVSDMRAKTGTESRKRGAKSDVK